MYSVVPNFLSSAMIVLSAPTMVASFFGMNFDVPFENNPHAFVIIFIISFVFSVVLALIIVKKQLF